MRTSTAVDRRHWVSAAVAALQPRERAAAARVCFLMTAVASVITVLTAWLSLDGAGRAVLAGVTVPVLGGLLAGCWALGLGERERRPLWATFPFATVACIVALDLLTHDGSAGAQVFLFFPALYAASQLRWPGAISVAAACIGADAIVVFVTLPAREAAVDLVYVAACVATITGLLVGAEERRAQVLEKLRRHAAIDPLTGLVTRRVLETAAYNALSAGRNHSGTGLILLDVDHFKTVNDSHGHLVGDEILVQVSGILLNLSRAEDTVSRMGGDEIALLLPGCSLEVAIERAEQIRSVIAGHAFSAGASEPLGLSVSVGVAHAPTHALELRTLYSAADQALYAAKRAGRDQVVARELPAQLPDQLGDLEREARAG